MSENRPSSLTIRRATPADSGAIRDLTRAAYAKWVPVIGREPVPMAADYDRAVASHRIDLLYVGQELAALVEIIDKGDHWLIENLAVHPEFQGRGLGTRALSHVERDAAAAKIGRMRLYTNKLFAENIRFYLARGYGIDREDPFRGGFIIHMSKRILPA